MTVRDGVSRPNITIPSDGVRVEITTQDSVELARHRRWRETILFATSLTLFVAIFLVALVIGFLSPSSDADTRKAAIGIVVTLIGALGGFLSGRAAK